jgi:hypothetical protein
MPTREPRKHHYLPQFYLAGFTASGRADDYLHVLDTQGLRQWKATVPNVAHERDLYRLDGNEEPGALERALATVETDLSPAVKRLAQTGTFTNDDDKVKVLNFVALMASRVPLVMDQPNQMADDIGKAMLREEVTTPERWAAACGGLATAGVDTSSLTYEQMKEFVERGEYSIHLGQNTVLSMMLDQVDTILPWLCCRSWTVAVAEGDGANFVCSDRPVSLVWTTNNRPQWAVSPGFGLLWVTVVMPISKNVAIIGTFGPAPKILRLGMRDVAVTNSDTGSHGHYILSTEADFCWLDSDGQVRRTTDLIAALQEKRAGGRGEE